MALNDSFSVNIAGDSVRVTVVMHCDMPDENGWQDSLQIVKLDSGSFMAMKNHGLALSWPDSIESTTAVIAEEINKTLK